MPKVPKYNQYIYDKDHIKRQYALLSELYSKEILEKLPNSIEIWVLDSCPIFTDTDDCEFTPIGHSYYYRDRIYKLRECDNYHWKYNYWYEERCSVEYEEYEGYYLVHHKGDSTYSRSMYPRYLAMRLIRNGIIVISKRLEFFNLCKPRYA